MAGAQRRRSRSEDEGNDEANQRQRLRESEAEEHVLANHAVGLRLAGDRLHTLAEDDADTDTRADRGEAVTDRSDGTGEFREKRHVVSFAFRADGGFRQSGVVGGYSVVCGHWPSVLRVQRAPYVDGSEQREDVGLQGLDESFESGQCDGDNEGRNGTDNSDDARANQIEGRDAERREQ